MINYLDEGTQADTESIDALQRLCDRQHVQKGLLHQRGQEAGMRMLCILEVCGGRQLVSQLGKLRLYHIHLQG